MVEWTVPLTVEPGLGLWGGDAQSLFTKCVESYFKGWVGGYGNLF